MNNVAPAERIGSDAEWYFIFLPSAGGPAEWTLYDLRRSEFLHPKVVLKSDHRSLVGLVEIEGRKLVVKRFILQETWWWFQFTSIFSSSLGEIAHRNAFALSKLGIATPVPMFHILKRRGRMCTGVCLAYPFIEGRPATMDDAPAIVEFIKRMHRADWIHRDPHPNNYLVTSRGLVALDPLRARHSRSRYLKAYDVMLLEHDLPDAVELYGRGDLGIYYHLAVAGHNLVRSWRGLKAVARRMFGST
ncbi:MAG: hypothetical protein FJY67_00920 [Calditrichaeota bacterium]|nr:hypothetical protein [Calditrichota bacterium]